MGDAFGLVFAHLPFVNVKVAGVLVQHPSDPGSRNRQMADIYFSRRVLRRIFTLLLMVKQLLTFPIHYP